VRKGMEKEVKGWSSVGRTIGKKDGNIGISRGQ